MAFPTIPTGGQILTSRQDTATTTHTFPSLSDLTKNAGDLLIAIICIYDGNTTDAEFSGWGGSFTEFVDKATATTVSIGAAYKFSTGSETGTFTVTSSGSARSGMFLMAIPGAHASTPPEGGGYATGTATACDPGAVDPAGWDVEDTLFIAVAGIGETSTGGAWGGITAAPTNYTGYVETGGTAVDAVGAIDCAVAFRQLAAASDDPGTFTSDESNTRWGALTIAVRPVAISLVTLATEADIATEAEATRLNRVRPVAVEADIATEAEATRVDRVRALAGSAATSTDAEGLVGLPRALAGNAASATDAEGSVERPVALVTAAANATDAEATITIARGMAATAPVASSALQVNLGGLITEADAANSYFSTPDDPSLHIAGVIDVRIKSATEWHRTYVDVMKWNEPDQRGWLMAAAATAPEFTPATLHSRTGSDGWQTNSTAQFPNWSDNTVHWIRHVFDRADNGNRTFKFYLSDNGVDWTQLGTTVTHVGEVTVFDSNAPVRIGAGNFASLALPGWGTIYRVEIRDDDTVVASPDFERATVAADNTITDAQGNVWSAAGTARFVPGFIVARGMGSQAATSTDSEATATREISLEASAESALTASTTTFARAAAADVAAATAVTALGALTVDSGMTDLEGTADIAASMTVAQVFA